MEAAGVDSGFRRNDGWGEAEWRLGEAVMESAGIDSGLRRNDGWGEAE